MRKKGFTLIELIVVIAIIGVLAALLVPVLIGYVANAKKKNDVTNAKHISQRVSETFSDDTDDNVISSFYSASAVKFSVTENSETYDLVVVCRMDGAKHNNAHKDFVWTASEPSCQDFVDALNDTMEFTNTSSVQLPIKYRGSKPANKWIIGYREDNPNTIEVWVGDAMGASECQPSYRLWSTVSHEYASPH